MDEYVLVPRALFDEALFGPTEVGLLFTIRRRNSAPHMTVFTKRYWQVVEVRENYVVVRPRGQE